MLERRGTKLLVVWPKCSNQLLSNQERPFSHMAPSSSPGKDCTAIIALRHFQRKVLQRIDQSS